MDRKPAIIELNQVSFTYAGQRPEAGIRNINLRITKGEVVLLCGRSGCGKTTLTRLINGLIPHYYEGALTGSVLVKDRLVAETPLYDMAGMVGSVFQNPRSQFFNVDTDSELAFVCENLGMPEEEVRARVQQTVNELGLASLLGRSIFELSGGEKQKIACGSVSTLKPDILVLDEPTSNLDMEGIQTLKEVLRHWKEAGKTVIIAEHRLYFLKDLADWVILMENGVITETYDGATFFRQPVSFYRERGLRLPDLNSLWQVAGTQTRADTYCRLENFQYYYRGSKPVLMIPEARLPMGRAVAIIGRNGAGKTTFVRSICGLFKRDQGIVEIRGKRLKASKRLSISYLVMQDVNHQLFTESVLDEVLLSMEQEDIEKAEAILESLDLLDYKKVHPMALSQGQKQRVAIAAALAAECEIFAFDEPTSGLDYFHMQQVADMIRKLTTKGKTLLIVTHDPELIEVCCTDVFYMEHGQIKESYPLDAIGVEKMKKIFFHESSQWE